MAVDYGALLQRAMDEEIGIEVETNNPHTMQITTDNYIRNNPQYKEIMVCIPSKPDTIFLVHKSVELDQ